MKLVTEGDYADHLNKAEKEDAAEAVQGFRCYDCGELFFGKPVYVLTDYHGETTPFCSECWEEYKTTIFANKFGF